MLVKRAEFKKRSYSPQSKIILALLMAIPYSLVPSPFTQSALAEGTSLKLSPANIRIQAQPPAEIIAPFMIENPSEEAISLQIGYKLLDSQNSENGQVHFLAPGQSTASQDQEFFDQVQVIDTDNFSHDTIELGPRQKKELKLKITLPSNQPTTDYYFSLVFLENITQADQTSTNSDETQQSSAITLQSGIGTNVFLAVGPKEGPSANVDTFATPSLKLEGPVRFLLQVANNGRHFIAPSGTITIKNVFGKTVGTVPVEKSVILAGTSRTHTSTTSLTTANDAQLLSGSTLIWPEKFLLGFYTATLDLSLSDEGPVVSRTINFTVFPLSVIFGSILFVGIGIIVFLRIKKKLQER